MNNTNYHWLLRAYLGPVLLFATALTLLRLYLFARYGQLFIADAPSLAMAFIQGIRFDLSTSFTISLLFILPVALPVFPGLRRVMTGLLYVLLGWQVVLLGYEFVDVHFYADTQRRLSYDILYAWQSVDVVMKMGVTGFLADTVVMLAALAGYGLLYIKLIIKPVGKMTAAEPSAPPGWSKRIGAFGAIALVTVIFIRGGFQFKPLGVSHAFLSANEAMGNLSMNGVFTTYQALYDFYRHGGSVAARHELTPEQRNRVLETIISPSEERIDPEYPLYRRFTNAKPEAKEMNVVLIIMESWTGKYLKSYGGKISGGPFFDELAKESLILSNCFANAQRTFEGALAIMASFPTWNPILAGHGGLSFQTRLRPVGAVFESMGYETLFIHGGEADSMGFHKLVKRLGFSRHISLDDFSQSGGDYDGIWGIYDEPLFLRANEEYKKIKKPFFSVILSLSSHLPFRLPSSDFDKYGHHPKPMSEFLNSMGYSDYALSMFFREAKKSGYYDDTVFIITADHTARYFSNHDMRESYLIPCLFHAPGLGLSGVVDRQASQLDIIPSILDIVGSTEPYTAWGKSVFAEGPRATALPRDTQSRVFVSDGYMLLADSQKVFGLFKMATGAQLDLAGEHEATARALHQQMKAFTAMSEKMILENKVTPP